MQLHWIDLLGTARPAELSRLKVLGRVSRRRPLTPEEEREVQWLRTLLQERAQHFLQSLKHAEDERSGVGKRVTGAR